MTDPRLQWIMDRLAEDEATAWAANAYWEWAYDYSPESCRKHIATWDPARALAVVAALWQILDEHALLHRSIGFCRRCDDDLGREVLWPCPTVRAIASIWADHDQYREMWCGESDAT